MDIHLNIILITIILKVKKHTTTQVFKLKNQMGKGEEYILKQSGQNLQQIMCQEFPVTDTFIHRKEQENNFNNIFGPLKFK